MIIILTKLCLAILNVTRWVVIWRKVSKCDTILLTSGITILYVVRPIETHSRGQVCSSRFSRLSSCRRMKLATRWTRLSLLVTGTNRLGSARALLG